MQIVNTLLNIQIKNDIHIHQKKQMRVLITFKLFLSRYLQFKLIIMQIVYTLCVRNMHNASTISYILKSIFIEIY